MLSRSDFAIKCCMIIKSCQGPACLEAMAHLDHSDRDSDGPPGIFSSSDDPVADDGVADVWAVCSSSEDDGVDPFDLLWSKTLHTERAFGGYSAEVRDRIRRGGGHFQGGASSSSGVMPAQRPPEELLAEEMVAALRRPLA